MRKLRSLMRNVCRLVTHARTPQVTRYRPAPTLGWSSSSQSAEARHLKIFRFDVTVPALPSWTVPMSVVLSVEREGQAGKHVMLAADLPVDAAKCGSEAGAWAAVGRGLLKPGSEKVGGQPETPLTSGTYV